MFANIQCTVYILWRISKDFLLAITCCPCVVWFHLLYLTVLQWLHCNMLGNYSIATNVWMCRSTAWVVVPDNHTTIAVDKAQCNRLVRTTRANTVILKRYIILWITILAPGCSSIYSYSDHHRSRLVIKLYISSGLVVHSYTKSKETWSMQGYWKDTRLLCQQEEERYWQGNIKQPHSK